MDQPPEKRSSRYGILSVVIVVLLVVSIGYTMLKNKRDAEMSANFAISYPKATSGWTVMSHGPQTLFLYGNRAKGLLLRGSVNQMISNVNPTPNLDRDNLAKLMVDNTHDNMPGWTAVVEDQVQAKGTSFRIVRRSENRHVVVTAFAVKGNTTLLVSLSGRNSNADQVDKDMNEFHEFISNIAMIQRDMSNW